MGKQSSCYSTLVNRDPKKLNGRDCCEKPVTALIVASLSKFEVPAMKLVLEELIFWPENKK